MVPPAGATWELGGVKGEAGNRRRAGWDVIASGPAGINLGVLRARREGSRWPSLPPSAGTPSALHAPRRTPREPSEIAFPSQVSLRLGTPALLSLELELGVSFSKGGIIWASPRIPESLVPTQWPDTDLLPQFPALPGARAHSPMNTPMLPFQWPRAGSPDSHQTGIRSQRVHRWLHLLHHFQPRALPRQPGQEGTALPNSTSTPSGIGP